MFAPASAPVLLRFYRYVFYWAYSRDLRKYDEVNIVAATTGMCIVAVGAFFNLFAAVILAGWLLHRRLVPSHLPKWQVGLLMLAFLVPHYYNLVHKGRYRRLAAEFDAWDADRRWTWNRRVILYLFGSAVAWGLSMYLEKNYPNPLHLP